ncbi:MAG TPA: energy transducer TonB [Flavipsychrobacter sp.]|nr:energy transducer TonB [Flavipsychrobacter sp.]
MKKQLIYTFLIATACCLSQHTFAQNKSISAPSDFKYEEQMPTPSVDISEYLQKNVKYPPAARAARIQGRVMLNFMVDSMGNIGDIKVVHSVHPLLDSEAVRVVRTMPKWTPGSIPGKRKGTDYTLPIEFRINGPAPQAPKPSVDIRSYLSKSIVYPADAKKKHIEGIVKVKFLIDTTGKVSEPVVTKYLYPSLDSEAVRIISKMPPFKPAMQNGKPVNVYFELPVNFKL